AVGGRGGVRGVGQPMPGSRSREGASSRGATLGAAASPGGGHAKEAAMAESPPEPFHVLMLFTTPPAQQREHAEKLATFIREGIKGQPGFLSARLFLTEDGEKVVEHFQ